MTRSKTLLISSALLALLTLRAQTSTQTPPQNDAVYPQPGKPLSLEDDPGFKKLSPEQQEWVRQMTEKLSKAMADKDVNAINQLTQEMAKHQSAYTYAKTSPCEAAPKKNTGFLKSLEETAKATIKKQAAKADAKIGTASGGTVVGVAQDTPTSTIADTEKPKPCTPTKQ